MNDTKGDVSEMDTEPGVPRKTELKQEKQIGKRKQAGN